MGLFNDWAYIYNKDGTLLDSKVNITATQEGNKYTLTTNYNGVESDPAELALATQTKAGLLYAGGTSKLIGIEAFANQTRLSTNEIVDRFKAGNDISFDYDSVTKEVTINVVQVAERFVGELMLWEGLAADIPAGWVIATEYTDKFLKIANDDAALLTAVGYTTALPSGTNFSINGFDDHRHELSGYTVNGTTGNSFNQNNRFVPAINALYTWEDYRFQSIAGVGKVMANIDNTTDTGLIVNTDLQHNHTYSIDIPTQNTSTPNGGATLTITGGDTTTAPDHIGVYLLRYVGV